MKRFTFYLTFLAFLAFATPVSWGSPYLVVEPPPSDRTTWGVAANGMVYVSYDLNSNGAADFYTLRIVEKSFYSNQAVWEVGNHFSNSLVFFTSYGQDRFYYVARIEPLFYAVDVNEDGFWDLIYKDVSEDGVNGNEVFYESPSGMFTSNIASF
jgi:hypothetical protein|tara:strand:- start:173 stop:634 length:462 start_codon:yes stop_codon:yes gene_type:complete